MLSVMATYETLFQILKHSLLKMYCYLYFVENRICGEWCHRYLI